MRRNLQPLNILRDDVLHVGQHLFRQPVMAADEERPAHDGVRAGERSVHAAGNVLIWFVVAHVARKQQARLDFVAFKVGEEIAADDGRCLAERYRKCEPVTRRFWMALGQDEMFRIAREKLVEPVEIPRADGIEVGQFFELREAERRLHFHRFEIVSHPQIVEFAVVIRVVQTEAESLFNVLIIIFRKRAAPVAIDFCFADERVVVHHYHAASAAGCDIVRGVKTRGGDVGPATGRFAVKEAPVRIAGILKEQQPVAVADCADALHIIDTADCMGDKNGLRLRRDGCLQLVNVKVVRADFGIHENRYAPLHDDGIQRGGEGACLRDDLAAGRQVRDFHSDEIRRRTGIHHEPVALAEQRGYLVFKRFGERARAEPAVAEALHDRRDFFFIVDRSRIKNAVAAGDKRRVHR